MRHQFTTHRQTAARLGARYEAFEDATPVEPTTITVPDDLTAVTADELVALREAVAEAVAAHRDAEPTEASVAALVGLADVAEAINAEQTRRDEVAAQVAADAADALARIDAATAAPADPTAAEDPPADPTVEVADPALVPVAAAVEATPAPVTAATVPALPTRIVIPAAFQPRPTAPGTPGRALVAAVGVPGTEPGGHIEPRSLQEAMIDRARSFLGANTGDAREDITVGRVILDFPADRQTRTGDVDGTMQILERIAAPQGNLQAVTAAGFCVPAQPDYRVVTAAIADRPVAASLPSVGWERGGMTFRGAPQLVSVDGGIGFFTEDNDIEGASKSCLEYDCVAATTARSYAVYQCVTARNFNALHHPEDIDALMTLLDAQQARRAERELLTRMGALATSYSTGQVLGTYRDIIENINAASAYYRNLHRLGLTAQLEGVFPGWLLAQMRADLVRQIPGDNALAAADSRIAEGFAAAGVSPTFALEGETGQDYTVQGAGSLPAWKTTAIWYLYHPGNFVHGVGPMLNVGVVRDSTLNTTNKFQVFKENFEGVAQVGLGSMRISSVICPEGSSAATVDTAGVCAGGS